MTQLELKIALDSRGLSTKGNKRKLQERLQIVVREEKEEELAYLALVQAKDRQEAEKEARFVVFLLSSL